MAEFRDNEDEDCCWICMGGDSLDNSLYQPCRCPRNVHARCLGRWQLQQAGRSEETHCRFCNSPYGDWRTSLTPRFEPSSLPPRPATPIMAISFEGQTHRIKVYPGPEGKARFEQQIRELIQLQDDEDFDVEFMCKAPDDSGQVLHLDGINAFDAATHCAQLTAAERISKQQQQQQAREQLQEAFAEVPPAPLEQPLQQQGSFAADAELQLPCDTLACPGANTAPGMQWFGP